MLLLHPFQNGTDASFRYGRIKLMSRLADYRSGVTMLRSISEMYLLACHSYNKQVPYQQSPKRAEANLIRLAATGRGHITRGQIGDDNATE